MQQVKPVDFNRKLHEESNEIISDKFLRSRTKSYFKMTRVLKENKVIERRNPLTDGT